jgi:hypothetical protein
MLCSIGWLLLYVPTYQHQFRVIVLEESKKSWLALPQYLLEFEIKIHPIPPELMKKFTAKDGVIFPYDNKYVQRYLYMMRDMYWSVYGIDCQLPEPLLVMMLLVLLLLQLVLLQLLLLLFMSSICSSAVVCVVAVCS